MNPQSDTTTLPHPFPAARYQFDFRIETPIRLPEYAGSTLRGAFGNALRRTACMTRQKDCKPCPLYRSCPYPAVFAPPPPLEHPLQKFSEIPAAFIVEPPPWGERIYQPGQTLNFTFVAIGHALAQLPLIVHAWQRAFSHGIGKGDGTASLERVTLADAQSPNDHLVFEASTGRVQPHLQSLPPRPDTRHHTDILNLEFVSPLRLQRNGQPIPAEQLESRDLLVALARRISLVSEFHTGRPAALNFTALASQAQAIESRKSLTWRDWKRYSSRQHQEMTLGGAMGTWTLTGDLAPFQNLIHLGQWLHVGKNASFGLGHYCLVAG